MAQPFVRCLHTVLSDRWSLTKSLVQHSVPMTVAPKFLLDKNTLYRKSFVTLCINMYCRGMSEETSSSSSTFQKMYFQHSFLVRFSVMLSISFRSSVVLCAQYFSQRPKRNSIYVGSLIFPHRLGQTMHIVAPPPNRARPRIDTVVVIQEISLHTCICSILGESAKNLY